MTRTAISQELTTAPFTPRSRHVAQGDVGPVTRLHQWCAVVVSSPDARAIGREVAVGPAGVTIGRLPGAEPGLAIDDPVMSRNHTWIGVTADWSSVQIRDLGSHNGTWIDGERQMQAQSPGPCVVRVGATVLVVDMATGQRTARHPATAQVPGHSARARLIREALAEATLDAEPVLIHGETGTGKEYAAQYLHDHALRRGKLVRVNVAAIPENLFESELFGHVAGAFTGATSARPGRVVEADEGTLVLDEIGELSLSLQPKLLRLVEEKLVRPVGGTKDRQVNVQFVASTNCDLDAMAREGRFRRDLLARFRSHVVFMPPLRERRVDLLDFADVLMPLTDDTLIRRRWVDLLSAETVESLLLHDWRDNLRELKTVLTRLRRLAAEQVRILPEELPAELRSRVGTTAEMLAVNPVHNLRSLGQNRLDGDANRRQMPSRAEMLRLLRDHAGNVNEIARATGRHRKQVYRWLSYAQIQQSELDRFRKP